MSGFQTPKLCLKSGHIFIRFAKPDVRFSDIYCKYLHKVESNQIFTIQGQPRTSEGSKLQENTGLEDQLLFVENLFLFCEEWETVASSKLAQPIGVRYIRSSGQGAREVTVGPLRRRRPKLKTASFLERRQAARLPSDSTHNSSQESGAWLNLSKDVVTLVRQLRVF